MKVNGKNLRDRILALVRSDARYANDDDLLVAAIWFQEGWRDPELYKKLKKVSSHDGIRRTRRKLTQEGIIKPSEKATEARYKEFKQVKEDLGYTPTIF